jgi:hypothetical protein
MTNVNDNVRISDNIGVVASSSSKQLSSIRTLSLPFFILNILYREVCDLLAFTDWGDVLSTSLNYYKKEGHLNSLLVAVGLSLDRGKLPPVSIVLN